MRKGTQVTTYPYDPFGNLVSSMGLVSNPYRYASDYFDRATNLYRFGTR